MLVPTKDVVRKHLKAALRDLPRRWDSKFDRSARQSLLQLLFKSLVGDNDDYLRELFKNKVPTGGEWVLQDAQGAIQGAEYTEAARGKPCGHILKSGEATYRCKTCTTDETCVLCSRCFEASDHQGHNVSVSLSVGNAGCCDCGDPEAWRKPLHCAIHTAHGEQTPSKMPEQSELPQDLVDSITATISSVLDFFCDVMSCAPEELRKAKSEASIMEDEQQARLLDSVYGASEEIESNPEYAMILWNDEKHAIHEVQEQIARACKKTKAFGLEKAHEVDELGRSFIMTSRDLKDLLNRARVIEQIKITVTIRSARDTFREQMASTIIEWLLDIAGCSVGKDNHILTRTICAEMVEPWERGSQASNSGVARDGLYDHQGEEADQERNLLRRTAIRDVTVNADGVMIITAPADEIDEPVVGVDDDDEQETQGNGQDAMDVDRESEAGSDLDMPAGDVSDALRGEPEDSLENSEATLAGYPPPPPPPIGALRGSSNPASSTGSAIMTPPESSASVNIPIPQTPYPHARPRKQLHPLWHWLKEPGPPDQFITKGEDIHQRVRLDWMILYDLRLWKKARVDLRDLYIGTLVKIPKYKRILGLRFAGLYTIIAQLYLIADREPDHSIIYLSTQMLTTPSVTREVVERCNFLTSMVAIIYTFLTTRQVGRPMDVSPTATLAFDAGSVSNRRMYHFFSDLRHLFMNDYVQEQLREKQYFTLQFLDLIKLPQGICPNLRAVGEHVEYENDAWIGASLLTREVNKLCRQFAEGFKLSATRSKDSTMTALRTVAFALVQHCLGLEKDRFTQAEIRSAPSFKQLNAADWDIEPGRLRPIVDFRVGGSDVISFHHAMHYLLSWLIDGAKSMSAAELRSLLSFEGRMINNPRLAPGLSQLDPESYLMLVLDYPLRVCAWLAHMKANMWVRNGLSLRHQWSQYRSVQHRNLAHQHDTYLVQVALVVCEPNRVLLTIIDRFGMADWMRGRFNLPQNMEEPQMIDVAEDLVHFLIILLSERTNLQPLDNDEEQQSISIRRELTHVLCFKPLSYSELCSKLIDRFQELDEFQQILDEMSNYKPPEGLSDTGSFELKKKYLASLDPYIAHYTKNQRDEAETAYRKWVSTSSGKPLPEIVFEPQLRPITSGLFADLNKFVGQPIFAQIIQNCLLFAVQSKQHAPNVPLTRIESYLQVVLHLVLISVNEDPNHEDSMHDDCGTSFVHRLLTRTPSANATFGLLYALLDRKEFEACHPKIKLVLQRMQENRPKLFQKASEARGVPKEQAQTAPSIDDEEALRKKKKAESEARAKKALASMQKQQTDFLNNRQNFDWGSDIDDDESLSSPLGDPVQMWDYPSGNCIYCQEECTDDKLYGTFALIKNSNILRFTDTRDADYVQEVLDSPDSLDRSAESIRPFGLASKNRGSVRKRNAAGEEMTIERQILGKGFQPGNSVQGPVSSSCGHIMHYNCFESYNNATIRRQTHQIARHHPERIAQMEFVCPLCKALGNSFLPIIWRGKEKRYPGVLESDSTFEDFITGGLRAAVVRYGKTPAIANIVRDESNANIIAYEALSAGTVESNPASPTSPHPSDMSALPHSATGSFGAVPPPFRNLHMPGRFPDDIYSTSPPLESAQTGASGKAMTNVYYRLRETIRKNHLPSMFTWEGPNDQLSYSDALARALGFSISAVEIAQRGVDSESANTFVDQASPVTLTHLRILSDMITSYISAGAAQDQNSRISSEIRTVLFRQLHQLFRSHPQIFNSPPSPVDTPAALQMDPFLVLAECTLYLVPKLQISYHHAIRICYLLEIVKDVNSFWRSAIDGFLPDHRDLGDTESRFGEQAVALRQFLSWSGLIEMKHNLTQEQIDMLCVYGIKRIRPNLLTFLRKTALLVNVTRGVDFTGAGFFDPSQPELERLAHALQLPSLANMLSSAGASESVATTHLQSTVKGWFEHFYQRVGYPGEPGFVEEHYRNALKTTHPVIFELIGLPKYYDTLLDEMTRRKCPTKKNKDMSDPAVCLFCGEFMCSQSVCCAVNKEGGCNRHMAKCGKDVGLFLHLRKSMVLYLHDKSGSWAQCPYLDRHGETDPGLRRTRQLMLNQKRYDALLRDVWLKHMIPTTIGRKLEADINNGGWETL